MKVYYDLHIHSALSPCGDDDMTPNNIVNMAKLSGLDIIAVTDHNSVGNCDSAVKVGKEVGVLVLYGMELETSEEVHIVTLFPDKDSADAFGRYVSERRLKIKNDERVYGKQTYLDENDEVVGSEEYLLVTATTIGVYEVAGLVKEFGGIAYPAHIDRYSHGLLQMLGGIDEDMGFNAVEISANASEDFIKEYEQLGYRIVRSSDAHYLHCVSERNNSNFCELEEVTARAVLKWLDKK